MSDRMFGLCDTRNCFLSYCQSIRMPWAWALSQRVHSPVAVSWMFKALFPPFLPMTFACHISRHLRGDCDPGSGEEWRIVTPWLRTSFSGLWPLERSKDLFLGIMIAALKRSRDLFQELWPTPLEKSQGSDPPFPAALVTSLVTLSCCWSTSSPTPLPHKLLGCWFLMGWQHEPKFFG